jgi:hypothetical protein
MLGGLIWFFTSLALGSRRRLGYIEMYLRSLPKRRWLPRSRSDEVASGHCKNGVGNDQSDKPDWE